MSSDFREFQEIEAASVPKAISERILDRIQRDLNPSAFRVFTKLLTVHLAMAVATLSMCPQLGFRIFGEGMGLMHYFMTLGEYGCMMACGGFFLGMSMAAVAFVFRPEELRVLRKTRWLEVGSVVLLSFMIFFAMDPTIAAGIAAAWLFGSFASALLVLEAGWRMRVRGKIVPA